ncbi:MAG: hypothetical protein ABII00_08040 [Elusimicrobiota bacterium]
MPRRRRITPRIRTTAPLGASSLLWAPLVLATAASSARAYIDPGSGSMMLQLLLAGAAGLLVLVKLFWRRVAALLRPGRGKDEDRR